MTPTGNQGPPKQPIDSVLAEFDSKTEALKTFCLKTKDLIEQILQDATIPFQSVQARVKSKEKLRQKYLNPEKNYTRLEDITDQAGLRVVTYYEDEVDRVVEKLKQEFDIDETNSVDKRETEPDKFGYYALNYVCKYPSRRTSQVEYKRFADVLCEIQVTSILRHAWSEIEHPWYDLRRAYPDDIKRRFARMAALMEIAEDEFLNLRKIRSDYQKSVDVQVAANVPDVPVDAVSLRSFIEQEPLVAEVDGVVASVVERPISGPVIDQVVSRFADAANAAGLGTIQNLYESLAKNKRAIPEFVTQCVRQKVWPAVAEGSLPAGVSIYQLAQLLMSAQSVQAISSFMTARAGHIERDISKQVAIAKEAVARFSEKP